MQSNPISFQEIEAYFRLNQIQPMDWELTAIRKLDEITLRARTPKTKGKDAVSEPSSLVSANDGQGVSSLMKGLASKSKKRS